VSAHGRKHRRQAQPSPDLQRTVQKPLELILARNLLSSISTPAFLLGEHGALLYYNEAAGAMLGRGFEDSASLTAEQWTSAFGPLGDHGEPLDYEQLPAVLTVREKRPYHGTFRIRVASGSECDVAASAIPIIGLGGSSGAIVFFWPLEQGRGRGGLAPAEADSGGSQP
jgi:PAS domain-containing protein